MTSTSNANVAGTSTPPAQQPMDWGRGHYERTAEALLPAAEAVVRAARLSPDESVLDVGCGTGSVALIAASLGCTVTAIDPAARLRDVARDRALLEGFNIQLLPGEAASIPLKDGSVDAVLSNFALILASHPVDAISETVRVLRDHGRVVFSAWVPGGAISKLNSTAMDLVCRALGAPPPPSPFPWHDETALESLFARHEMAISVERHELVFEAESPAVYLEEERTNHPMAVAGFEVFERLGQTAAARQQLLRVLEVGNEDPAAFRSTSKYIVVSASR